MKGTIIVSACMAIASAQLPGVSDPFYECTDGSETPALDVRFGEVGLTCGLQLSLELSAETPTIAFQNATSLPYDYYTLLILNPDDIIPIQPISHLGAGNVASQDLAAGVLGDADIFDAYRGPNPPSFADKLYPFNYCVILFGQEAGLQNFSDARGGGNFPLQEFVSEKRLAMLQQVFWVTSINGCKDGSPYCAVDSETNTAQLGSDLLVVAITSYGVCVKFNFLLLMWITIFCSKSDNF